VTEAEFSRLAAAGHNRIPIVAEASADLYTPLAVYTLLAGGPYSCLLESVVGGERFGLLTGHGHKMLENFIKGT